MKTLSLTQPPAGADEREVAAFASTLPTCLLIVLVVVLGIGGLGVWSFTAVIAKGAVAEGSIVVESTRKTIQHLEGGIVEAILVKDGDYVKAGQALLKLSDSRSILTYAFMQDKLDQDIAMTSRLIAERDGRDTIEFDRGLLERAKTNAADAEFIEAQKQQLEARRKSEQGKADLLNQKVEELKQQIVGLEAQVSSKTIQLTLLNDELTGMMSLLSKGLEAKTKVLALQRSVQDVIGGKAQNMAEIAGTKVSIGEAQMQMLQNQRAFHEEVVEKLREVSADRLEVSDHMASLKETMLRLTVISPIDGQVVGSIVHTIGGVVGPGEKLMDIVPGEDRLVVDAHIPPNEINNVQIGLPVEVRLTALRQRTAPTLNGKISTVSTDILTDPATHQPYYSGRVQIDAKELGRLGSEKLVAGMPAEILIKNGERTVMGYLFAPIADAVFRSFRQD